jgi:YD repeat-containing protein
VSRTDTSNNVATCTYDDPDRLVETNAPDMPGSRLAVCYKPFYM